MFTERARRILEATIEEFIETGEPVSSSLLYKNHDFGIKPAMIRSELEHLAETGFLEQPYRSAGKTPSDRGYEFFADEIIRGPSRKPTSEDDALWGLFEERAWEKLLAMMSPRLGVLGVVRENRKVHKNGIEHLVERLEWDMEDEIKAVIRGFARIEERLSELELPIKRTPEVFIGKNNPIMRSRCLAIVGGTYETEDGHVTLFAVGPKRMDYKKTVGVFKNFKNRRQEVEKYKKLKIKD